MAEGDAAWTDFCARLDALDDEQCLTWYCTTYHLMDVLRKEFTAKARKPNTAMKAAKLQLLEAFAAGAPACIRVDTGVFVRLSLRQVTGKDINIATLADALRGLDVPSASEALVAEQRARYAAWVVSQTKPPPKPRKNARPSLKRKADTAAAAPEPEPLPLPPPPEPEIKYVGANRVPTRKELPFGRPLTVRELLAQVVYNSAHKLHKPKRPFVSVLQRVASGGVVTLDTLSDAVQGTVLAYLDAQRALREFRESVSDERERRLKYARTLAYLRPRLLAYIKATGGKQSRAVPFTDGERTFTLQATLRKYPARSLTLWEMSQLVDELTLERFPDCAFDASACPVTFDADFIDELQLRVQQVLDGRERSVEGLRVHRGQLYTGGGPPPADELDENGDYDAEDAAESDDADPDDADADPDAALLSALQAKLEDAIDAGTVPVAAAAAASAAVDLDDL